MIDHNSSHLFNVHSPPYLPNMLLYIQKYSTFQVFFAQTTPNLNICLSTQKSWCKYSAAIHLYWLTARVLALLMSIRIRIFKWQLYTQISWTLKFKFQNNAPFNTHLSSRLKKHTVNTLTQSTRNNWSLQFSALSMFILLRIYQISYSTIRNIHPLKFYFP